MRRLLSSLSRWEVVVGVCGVGGLIAVLWLIFYIEYPQSALAVVSSIETVITGILGCVLFLAINGAVIYGLVMLFKALSKMQRDRAAQRIRFEAQQRQQRIVYAQTLNGMLALSPRAFEQFVGDLLIASGYQQVQHTGGSGDLGADLMCVSPQGERMVVQCKRYAPSNLIGSPAIQQFIGMAHVHHQAQASMFVTTSDFTRPATALAQQHSVILIDGHSLTLWAQQVSQRPPMPPPAQQNQVSY